LLGNPTNPIFCSGVLIVESLEWYFLCSSVEELTATTPKEFDIYRYQKASFAYSDSSKRIQSKPAKNKCACPFSEKAIWTKFQLQE
jgi:hypothetical protein